MRLPACQELIFITGTPKLISKLCKTRHFPMDHDYTIVVIMINLNNDQDDGGIDGDNEADECQTMTIRPT